MKKREINKQLNKLVTEEEENKDYEVVVDQETDKPELTPEGEEKELREELTPEELAEQESGEESFNGDSPDPSVDDDIDELGEAYGVTYKEDETLDVARKIKP